MIRGGNFIWYWHSRSRKHVDFRPFKLIWIMVARERTPRHASSWCTVWSFSTREGTGYRRWLHRVVLYFVAEDFSIFLIFLSLHRVYPFLLISFLLFSWRKRSAYLSVWFVRKIYIEVHRRCFGGRPPHRYAQLSFAAPFTCIIFRTSNSEFRHPR